MINNILGIKINIKIMIRLQSYFSTIELSTGYLHLAEIQKIIKMELKGKSGIYGFLCKTNNKLYIGSSSKLSIRFNKHINGLQSNVLLQNAINKYNLQDFIFVIFEYCETDKLLSREQYYLDTLEPEFNILKIAGSCLGLIRSKENRDKISKFFKGVPLSEEHKLNISKARLGELHPMYGRNHSDSTKIKMSIAKGTPIFVYSNDSNTLVYNFTSLKKASEFFNCSDHTIKRYLNGKLFKKQWILTTSIKDN